MWTGVFITPLRSELSFSGLLILFESSRHQMRHAQNISSGSFLGLFSLHFLPGICSHLWGLSHSLSADATCLTSLSGMLCLLLSFIPGNISTHFRWHSCWAVFLLNSWKPPASVTAREWFRKRNLQKKRFVLQQSLRCLLCSTLCIDYFCCGMLLHFLYSPDPQSYPNIGSYVLLKWGMQVLPRILVTLVFVFPSKLWS